jgi:hypothetical protein
MRTATKISEWPKLINLLHVATTLDLGQPWGTNITLHGRGHIDREPKAQLLLGGGIVFPKVAIAPNDPGDYKRVVTDLKPKYKIWTFSII